LKNRLKISLLLCCLFGFINFSLAQKDSIEHVSLKENLEVIRLLTDSQQYSEAIKKLIAIEDSEEIYATLKNQVSYRLMMARVLRLSGEYDRAMEQMNLLPNLKNDKDLILSVNFRKAALYMENPKYSMEETIKIVMPIIEEGIKVSKEINNIDNLAAFSNLKAGIYSDECNLLKRNCKVNNEIAIKYYKKSMNLYLSLHDTLNYHNVLNGLFRLSIGERTADLDSLRDLVLEFTSRSSFGPNVLASRNRLATYYMYIHNDTLNYLRQKVLEKDAMIDKVSKNADNTIGKLKLLYEFDSLKADLNLNKGIVVQKDLVIQEKNRRIYGNILFSLILGVLALISILLFIRHKKLSKKMNLANRALQYSNHNYELLIKESNHRIKNNLQMILSIIELEKKVDNEEEHILLRNISSKILTIAALHRILDFKEHNQKVKLPVYFIEIIQYFEDLSKNKIVFTTDFENVKLQSERIIYFGLVLNELISNTLEHSASKNEVVIQVLKSDKNYIFIYRDNSDFGEFTKNNGINLIENLIGRFGGTDLKFTPQLGEYKFYFNE
jgi:two-component sensor histidine kinase